MTSSSNKTGPDQAHIPLQHLAALVGRPLHIEHRIDELFVAAEIVRSGRAAAIMPRVTASPLAVSGMVLRPIEGVHLVRHVDVLARPDRIALRPVQNVLTALRRIAADQQR